jgi:hypothetical protein
VVSDLLLAVSSAGGLGVLFISDGNLGLPSWGPLFTSAAPGTMLDETGTFQDLTCLLYTCTAGTATPYLVGVTSDVQVVPEPPAYALFAAGVGLLGMAIRRLRTR